MRMRQSDPGRQEGCVLVVTALHVAIGRGAGRCGAANYDPFGGIMGSLVISILTLIFTSVNWGYISYYLPSR